VVSYKKRERERESRRHADRNWGLVNVTDCDLSRYVFSKAAEEEEEEEERDWVSWRRYLCGRMRRICEVGSETWMLPGSHVDSAWVGNEEEEGIHTKTNKQTKKKSGNLEESSVCSFFLSDWPVQLGRARASEEGGRDSEPFL
jgi:hypothetical protein